MPNCVFYSTSPFGTGDISNGSPNITITSGVATLSVAQTGNIGAGCCIEYNSLKVYIAPNRLGFDSGGTVEIKVGDKIEGGTSGATGIVRQAEVTSGTWSGGDAAGYIYFEETSGTWQDNEQINIVKPGSSSNVATVNGTLQGNIGNGNTQFVVKTATGGTPSNQTSVSVTSIHHEYASLSALDTGYTDGPHINSTDLTSSGADVIVHGCCYYDHSAYSTDSSILAAGGVTTDSTNYLYIYCPRGGSESINKQCHDGKWDSNKYIITNTNNQNSSVVSLTYSSNEFRNARVDGLQVKLNSSNYSSPYGIAIDASYTSGESVEFYVSSCIVSESASPNYGHHGIHVYCPLGNTATQIKIDNCIVYDFIDGSTSGSTGYSYNFYGYSTIYVYNCVAYNSNYGFYSNYTTLTLKNCVSFNNTDDFNLINNPSSTPISYCASDDGDGTNSVTPSNWSNVFTDYSNYDFSLLSTDTDLMDAGTDLSADANFPIWRDIAGTDRTGGTWDIGAFEYVSIGQSASLSDTLSLLDSRAVLAGYKISRSDTISLSESREGIGNYLRSISDILSLSETQTPVGYYSRSTEDSLRFGEGGEQTGHYNRSAADTLNLTDTITVTAAFSTSLSDTLTLTDNVSAVLSAIATISDILSLTDVIEGVKDSGGVLEDTVSFTDSVTARADLLAAFSDVLSLSDTQTALAKLQSVLTDTLNLSDELSTQIIGNLSDVLTFSDSAEAVAGFIAQLTDTLSLSEDRTATLHLKVSLSDNLSLGETIEGLAKYAAALVDTLSLTDVVTGVKVTARGEVTISFGIKMPSVTFSAKKPNITFTSH